ncbi:cysteine hydrolase family protein [Nisaea sediminum]|uniref:cysteine hydrolase family protein n=1 Tax=Nisaea sediminum TaxID=2775867 RepID=UPI001867A7A2|nr:isochorismatase family protein [Nisaea sediminum]
MSTPSFANTALLVIDAQESFRQRDYWDESVAAPYLAAQQRLIDGAHDRGIPVVQIFHLEDGNFFDEANGFVRTIAPLSYVPDAHFKKRRHSALVGSGLDVWLASNGIRKLIVSGIRTEQCCETTTRHLSDSGYKVDFVTEATLTFAMTHADGTVFSPEDIKRRTELVLSGRFARICTIEVALAAPRSAVAA